MTILRQQAEQILQAAIEASRPEQAVQRALLGRRFSGRVRLAAVGKAAWQMAKAACDLLGDTIEKGVVLTKYGHAKGPIGRLAIREAGHPMPDENGFSATREILQMAEGLTAQDTVLLLVSGGGSALFEDPLIPAEELADITGQLLACGADIREMNTIRKRLSRVKGGRFAQLCAPARVLCVALSDVLGDAPDCIASGPACPDPTTAQDAQRVVEKYHLRLSPAARQLLKQETPKNLDHTEMCITGSVRQLCAAAADASRELGYRPVLLTDSLDCEARQAGCFLAAIARSHVQPEQPLALIAGGETVVTLTGQGLGGRSQELALAAAQGISGLAGVGILSAGSDGTDGPTDAAGGYVDGDTLDKLHRCGLDVRQVLEQNNSYHALKAVDGLVYTGPTGTNVNDLTLLLIRPGSLQN